MRFWSVDLLYCTPSRFNIKQLGGEDKPMSFTQAFQLKNDAGNWFVLNDVFRLVYPAA